MDTTNRLIESAEELEALVMELGLLPLVPTEGLDGLSVKAYTPPRRWFARGVEGPWEWREALAARGNVIYGKLFGKKAGFITLPMYAALLNWRRKGMDFETRYACGMIPRAEKQVMDLIGDRGPVSSRELRGLYGSKGLDTVLTSLQMRTDLAVQGFMYKQDAQGQAYGMGITMLVAPEARFGTEVLHAHLGEPPEVSLARLADRVHALCPGASERAIERFLR